MEVEEEEEKRKQLEEEEIAQSPIRSTQSLEKLPEQQFLVSKETVEGEDGGEADAHATTHLPVQALDEEYSPVEEDARFVIPVEAATTESLFDLAMELPIISPPQFAQAIQDAFPKVAQDANPVLAEDATPVVGQDAPPVVVEDALPEAAQDTPSEVVEDATQMVAEDAPAVSVEDALAKAATDTPSVIAENTTPMAAEDAPAVVVEDALPEAAQDTPSAIAEDTTPMAAEDASALVVEDALPKAAQDTPSVTPVDTTTMVAEDAPAVVVEDALLEAAQDTPSVTPEDTTPMVAEDAPAVVVEDALPEAAQDTASVTSEDTTPMVAEDAPAVVVEDALPKAAQGTPSVIAEDTTPMVAEDAPALVVDDALPKPAQGTPSVVAEYATPMVAEDAPAVVVEDALPKAALGTPSVVAEYATPMVAEDAPAVVVEDTPPKAAQDTPSVVAEDATPMVAEDAPAVDVEDTTSNIENASSAIAENVSIVFAKDDSPMVNGDTTLVVDEPASSMATEEVAHTSEVDMEMELEAEIVDTGTGDKKRKRGRPPKVQARAPVPKIMEEEEDVCFICFDGGNLVLCDRRGCPKAYHPICVNRDEAFFRSRGRWNCGWHICSNCEKGANYMCYTCTYSLCKGCIKEADFVCVRGNKGFCQTCMRTVMLIEKNEQGQVNFDDKSSWEYLFKEYWIDLKRKQSLTLDELTQAKNPFKGSNILARKEDSSEELYDANDDKGSDSDGSTGHVEMSSKKRKPKKQSKLPKEGEPPSRTHSVGDGTSPSSEADWASKDLLNFVGHMKDGDKSPLSQYDVQALFLNYIKINNLRDPRKKSQIVCDARLENLFGKARVGHIEMLKLLESHFFVKEDTDDIQRATADTEGNQLDSDGTPGSLTRSSSDKRRKSRRKGDGRGMQTNLDDYAAIDVNNIKLLYLRRNLMEDLLEDSDKFHDRVAGSFVRIRISGSGQKQDMYRLVQVTGTRKAAEPYKTGKRSADVVLEILNLNKTEAISIDTISNQDFTEDECKRLRQSIKCGLISRMSVGEVQEKAIALQAVRVNDWLETEKLRISHLRDRASEQGRRKDLRECVEKLQLLNTPEERSRRLQEIPQVHADPKMDPNYISDEEDEQDDRSQDNGGGVTPRDSAFTRTARDPISPGRGSPASLDTWSGSRKSSVSDSGRNISIRERSYNGGGSEPVGNDPHHLSNSWDAPKNLGPTFASTTVVEQPPAPAVAPSINETDKMWHYQDPSKKTQGPFSMVQLRKWSTTGHFPVDLRIWRITETQQDSILLTDALLGKYTKEVPLLPAVTPINHRNDRTIANTSSWADQNRTSHSNWDVSGYTNGNDASAGGWSSPTPDSGRGGVWGDARVNNNNTNAWGGRSSYSAQPQRPVYNQGGHRGGGGGGRWGNRDQNRGGNNWNSNRQSYNRGGGQPYNVNNNSGRGGSSWGDNNSRGWGGNIEPPKPVMTEGWGNRNNNLSNFPSPTPANNSNSAWNTEQWSPTPGAAGNNGGWGQRPMPIALPNQVLGDYSSPPTPTPATPTPAPAGNYVHPH